MTSPELAAEGVLIPGPQRPPSREARFDASAVALAEAEAEAEAVVGSPRALEKR
jgi:hypothetical protein